MQYARLFWTKSRLDKIERKEQEVTENQGGIKYLGILENTLKGFDTAECG